MWMRAPDGLAMVLFGPCDVRTNVGNVGVRLAEETDYPFSEQVTVRVDPDSPVDFVLHVRVPAWATGVDAGCPGAESHRAGDWLLVAKRWQAGDTLEPVRSGRRSSRCPRTTASSTSGAARCSTPWGFPR